MMDHLKGKAKTMWANAKNRHKSGKSDKPLIEKNNNDVQDGHSYDNPMANNVFNQEHFQRLYSTCGDGYVCPVQPNSEQENSKQDISCLNTRVVSDSFPKSPAELDQNLKQHLLDLSAFSKKLQRIDPQFSGEMKGYLINRCHHQMFAHLHNLLQNISWSTNCLVLMNWVSDIYLSQDMPGNPHQQLLNKWEAKANVKLFESLKKETSESLHKILITHRRQKCHDDENYVGLYVDAIQCVDGHLQRVCNISSALYDHVKEICFQELLKFVKSYAAEQDVFLSNEEQTWKEREEQMETVVFLKTLKTCKELRTYVQLNEDDIQLPELKETLEVLEKLETSTFNFLKKIVSYIAERGVKSYFKSGNWYNLQLETLSNLFPNLSYGSDEQKMVMNEAYKIFAHTYLKHLIKKRCCRRKLRPWMSDGGILVQLDAHDLHSTFSKLAPGVQPWNLMLLKIPEVLHSNDIEGLKLTVAQLQKDCVEQSVCSEDLQLLPALLRWKGLSNQKVNEVLEALPGGPPGDDATVNTRTRLGSFFLCLICCS
ncbi:uncharacterized protein si:dkey-196h17.9 [Melanotaenia boesemani]|uniref:uncharacterized protein si:dkey-196h17.9 n=1 Tax=Melanotaenia boesemani TaxID=1250792 RepID=UPI001C03AFEA|nr:uncharacterized protein si:dkey-196h17.9 [Melanotaenia boesemani]